MPTFDAEQLRADFPILSSQVDGKPLTYLDNGATSQKPQCVIDLVDHFYEKGNANIHRGVHFLSRTATEAYEEARRSIKAALNTPNSHELIFLRGATEAINLVTNGLEEQLKEGDEIILTIMEHHANFVPWQVLAERKGLKLHFIGLNDDGSLDLETWKEAFNPRTRLVAFTHISNVLGTINPVEEMTAFAHEQGALVLVDGAQALPHGPADLTAIGADFYVFSGHKVFAPDGIGVLVGSREILNGFRPYQTGGDMIDVVSVKGTTFRDVPERFEAGTPNISGALGLAEAFRYMEKIDWEAAAKHERSLADHATKELGTLGDVRLFGTTDNKTAIVSFLYDVAHPHDVATILDTEGVAVRDGHHCAQPLMDYLGVSATVRASFAFYNNEADVESFMRGMHKVKRFFG